MESTPTHPENNELLFTEGFQTFRPNYIEDDQRDIWSEEDALAGIEIIYDAFNALLKKEDISQGCKENLSRGLINIFTKQADRLNKRLNDAVNVELKTQENNLDGKNEQEDKTDLRLRQIENFKARLNAIYLISSHLIHKYHTDNQRILPYGNLYDPDSNKMLIINGNDHIRSINNENNTINYTHRIIMTGGQYPNKRLIKSALEALQNKFPNMMITHTGESNTEKYITNLAIKMGIHQEIMEFKEKGYESASTVEAPDKNEYYGSRPYFPNQDKTLGSVPNIKLNKTLSKKNPELAETLHALKKETAQENEQIRNLNEQYNDTYLGKVDELFRKAEVFCVVSFDNSISSRAVLGRAAQYKECGIWKVHEAIASKTAPVKPNTNEYER